MKEILEKGYWIMPNTVLFNSQLKDKEKLLFILISSLTAEKGYCFASNHFLADKLNTARKWWNIRSWKLTPNTISRYVSKLKKLWYISIQYIYENKCIVGRKIYIWNIFSETKTKKEIKEKDLVKIKEEINNKYKSLPKNKKLTLFELAKEDLTKWKKVNLNLYLNKIK